MPKRSSPEPSSSPERARAVAATEQQIATLTRRVHMNAAQMNPDLSYSAYAILSFVQASGGCRARDLAEHYGLDKSTLSRQLADLLSQGLIGRETGAADRRVQVLRATEAGQQRLRRVSGRMNAALERRVQGWSDGELEAFARLLTRYNAGPAGEAGEG